MAGVRLFVFPFPDKGYPLLKVDYPNYSTHLLNLQGRLGVVHVDPFDKGRLPNLSGSASLPASTIRGPLQTELM